MAEGGGFYGARGEPKGMQELRRQRRIWPGSLLRRSGRSAVDEIRRVEPGVFFASNGYGGCPSLYTVDGVIVSDLPVLPEEASYIFSYHSGAGTTFEPDIHVNSPNFATKRVIACDDESLPVYSDAISERYRRELTRALHRRLPSPEVVATMKIEAARAVERYKAVIERALVPEGAVLPEDVENSLAVDWRVVKLPAHAERTYMV